MIKYMFVSMSEKYKRVIE